MIAERHICGLSRPSLLRVQQSRRSAILGRQQVQHVKARTRTHRHSHRVVHAALDNKHEVIIIGAGAAGLSCGLTLQKAGIPFTILEASDGVGGRVRTDEVDGFKLDRGFQIFLTSYPEAEAALDYGSLQLQPFYAGAMVRHAGRFHRVADPARHLPDSLGTLLNPVGSVGDKINVGWYRLKSAKGTLDTVLTNPETTTLKALQEEGFSQDMIDRFFRPFLGGIFFDTDLNVTSRLLQFVMRMLATGQNCLPAQGIGAVSQQLAQQLPSSSIHMGVRVEKVTGSTQSDNATVRTADGKELTASRGVVVATEGPAAQKLLGEALELSPSQEGAPKGTCNLYFRTATAPPPDSILYLNGDGEGIVNNACFPSTVAPSYAPQGQHLVSLSTIGTQDELSDDQLASQAKQQMAEWFGPQLVDDWQLLKVYRISYAQPPQAPPTNLARAVQLGGRLYVAGDHRDTATLDGALKSGRRAAEALLADTAQETSAEKQLVDATEMA